MILHLIPQIEYAVRRKNIPIIDCRETYLPMIQDQENAGKENAWEYYFQQPIENYTLDEVYQSKHVVYVRKNAWGIKKSLSYNDIFLDDDKLTYWSGIFNRYLRFPMNYMTEFVLKRTNFWGMIDFRGIHSGWTQIWGNGGVFSVLSTSYNVGL